MLDRPLFDHFLFIAQVGSGLLLGVSKRNESLVLKGILPWHKTFSCLDMRQQ
jgi:hypothetical protein